MTATPIGVEISCDGPDEHTDCPDSAAIRSAFTSRTAWEVRADGRVDGWTTRRDTGRLRDVCPVCTRTRQDAG
ncbi:hypothetical protein ACPCTG_31730 [Streptomyces pseudogriseolus]|uniref:hypothetical protein n=1 Tax=Streptomyces pseudogriseolus TaxID=36817 RepID=UPI003FA24DC8